MQRVPYEGTSRMQTSLRRRQRDRVVRRSVPLPFNSVFNPQPLPKRASTDRVQSSVPEQRSGHDDRERFLCHRRRPPVRIPVSNFTFINAYCIRTTFLFSGISPISSSPSGASLGLKHRDSPTYAPNRPLTLAPWLLQVLRPGGPHRIGCRPTRAQPTAPNSLPDHPLLARVQTCNFDVLYAVRTRVLNHQSP